MVTARHRPYPYSGNDYHRVTLAMVTASPEQSTPSGSIILVRENNKREKEERESCLVLAVGGDSLLAISGLVSGASPQRPIALDLLWTVQPFSQCLQELLQPCMLSSTLYGTQSHNQFLSCGSRYWGVARKSATVIGS